MKAARLIGVLACSLAALMVLVTGFALYTSLHFAGAEDRARMEITEALSYSRALDQLKDAVLDAETGQRGYLLTGDRGYLQPYFVTRETLEGGAATSDIRNVLESDENAELKRLVDLKLSELAQTIAYFDSGSSNAALSIVQTDRGRDLMRDIRTEISRQRVVADRQASEATNELRDYVDQTGLVTIMLAASMGLATLMGFVCLLLWARESRATVEAGKATEAVERIEVIADELNHRMKNIFAVTQGMLRQSSRGYGEDVEGFAAKACDRMMAMSHAYSMIQGYDRLADLGTDDLIREVVQAQKLDHHLLKVEGPSLNITQEAMTPIALILHEWTTNALKYGAWSSACEAEEEAGITIQVSWTEQAGLQLTWDERCDRMDQEAPQPTGYGSKLIKACAMQIKSRIETDWHDGGVVHMLSEKTPRIVKKSPKLPVTV